MKRLYLSFGIILCLTIASNGQKFNGGFILGGIVSQLDGDYYGGYHKFGELGGVFVNLNITEKSSFQMEIEFIQKGSRKNADSIGNTADTTFLNRFNYLEIPVLYQLRLYKGLSAEIGPAVDILISSKVESNGLDASNAPNQIPLRPVTLSGIIGVSYDLSKHLRANFRVNYSLLSIRNIHGFTEIPDSYRYIFWQWGQFNNVMSLSLIWYFKEMDFGL
jgi:hypothetical protein